MEKGNYMSEVRYDLQKTLAHEAVVLDYWRKRYLWQAFFVLIIEAFLIGAVWYYTKILEVIGLVLGLEVLVFYLMLKELRESLQTRGEGLILPKGDMFFEDISFDYGKGIAESVLNSQDFVSSYKTRECRNVMRGKNYLVEEDWFYTLNSVKSFSVYQTAFEGVVWQIDCAFCKEDNKGQVVFKNGKTFVTGDLVGFVNSYGILKELEQLNNFFLSREILLVVKDKKLYIWFATQRKLFYQFRLLGKNTLSFFVKRVDVLDKIAISLAEKLRVC